MTLRRDPIPSPNFSNRYGSKPRLLVVHTAEGATTYQDLGRFFQTPGNNSSHVGTDDTVGTVGQYVTREWASWTVAA